MNIQRMTSSRRENYPEISPPIMHSCSSDHLDLLMPMPEPPFDVYTLLDLIDDHHPNNYDFGVFDYFSDPTTALHDHEVLKSSEVQLDWQAAAAAAAAASHKQRIRWTTELHDLFLDAIKTLGGPEYATPKKILGIMNVKGLSIYHVKSHLQKYRLAKNVPELKQEKKGSTSSTKETYLNNDNIDSHIKSDNVQVTEALRMQIELQKLLHDQLKAQRELHLSIEQNAEFLKKLIEKQNNAIGTNNITNSSSSSVN